MHRYLTLLLAVLLQVSLAAGQEKPTHPVKPTPPVPSKTPAPGLPSEETVNGFMHETFGYDPSVTWKILEIKPSEAAGISEVSVLVSSTQGQQNSKFYVTTDGQHAMVGEIIPFGAHPYAAAQERLQKENFGPSRGPADAPVLLVEFSDLQCPHCKAAQPIVEKLLSEEAAKLRIVFQNFPLPSHDWAAKAAAYEDCIARVSSDAAWKFIQGTYDSQGDITVSSADEKFKALADAAGAKSADVATCADQPETMGRVERSTGLGRSLGVGSTPTLFINGRKINNVAGLPFEMLKQLVEFAASEKK